MAKATQEEKEAVYERPATQDNLEAFYEREKVAAEAGEEGLDLPQPYQVPSVTRTDLEPRFEVSDEDRRAFVGVDEMYQNYASDTDKPLIPDEGPEAENWKRVLGEIEEHPETDPGEVQEGESAEPKKSVKASRQAPPPPPGE